jgi:hypothetical protein
MTMLAEIFLLKLEAQARAATASNPSRTTSDPRFVPVTLPRS